MKNRRILTMIAFAVVIGTALGWEDARAISVPKVSIDESSYTLTDRSRTFVSGTVSPAVGQLIVLYSADRKDALGAVRISKGRRTASFRIKVPETAVQNKTSLTLYIRSTAAEDVAASKFIPVEMKEVGKVEATTKRTTKATKETSKSVGKSAKATKARGKKNKKSKNFTRPTTAAGGRSAAVAWARMIAADNRFTYGAVPYSRHNGCYFCGTNGGKKKRARGTRWADGYKGRKWNRTYCCNPFVHACYAHGAQHPKMLRYCKRKDAIDMTRASYRRMGCFRSLGKPEYSKLIPGDILVTSTHVMLYCGKGKIAEATSIDGGKKSWGASSIRIANYAKRQYRRCRFVMRFTGY